MSSNFNFDFDLGIGSNKSRSLNEQKNKPASYAYTSGISGSTAQQPKPAWQPNKPSWTHQPAPPTQPSRVGAAALNGPASMVGDIFGKSWGSTSGPSGSGIGVVEKNPSLFGDLVSSALGQGKSNSNAPLKNAAPVSGNKSAYSMGGLSDSLPKSAPSSAKSGGSWGSDGSFGNFKSNTGVNLNGSTAAKSTNLGGTSMKTMSGACVGTNANKDPFSNLVGLGGSKQPVGNLNSSVKTGPKVSSGNDSFGDFQNASKSSTSSAFPSSGISANNSSFPKPSSSSSSKMDDFGMNFSSPSPAPQAATQNASVDQFDSLFSTSSASGGGRATASEGFGGQQMEDDWGLGSDFGGGNDSGGATTELEGLPPPPAGVSASMAKNKGMDNYKQGQYADAIKWLSWAEVLLAKAGDNAAEVLTSRASCYKEVGEYKKAVADCTKVLEHDESNVAVLVQRALLYESMEKYRLGAEDLRTVLKIDPGNRIARSTIHRLNKLAD